MNHSQNAFGCVEMLFVSRCLLECCIENKHDQCFITLCVCLKLFWVDLKFTYSSDTSPEGIADESNTSHRQ